MSVSIIAAVALPLLALIFAVGRAAVSIVHSLGRCDLPRRGTVAVFFSGLVVIVGALSMVITVDAALSHSEAAKAASRLFCLALVIVLVVAPALALGIAVRRVRLSKRSPSPDPT